LLVFEPKELFELFVEKLLLLPPKAEGLPKLLGVFPKDEVFVLLFPKVVPPFPKPVFELELEPKLLVFEPKVVEFCPKPKVLFDGVELILLLPPKEKEPVPELLFDPKVEVIAWFGVEGAPKEKPPLPPPEGAEKLLPKLKVIGALSGDLKNS